MPKLKIAYKPIEDLIPYARNSRTHSDSQIAQIASSIREFGWTNPVLLDGENGIIAGHGRVMAARILGETQIPTIELAHLNENQKRAYVIADNKIGLNADWDKELLKLELDTLSDLEKINTGFSSAELSLIYDEWVSDIDQIGNINATDATAKQKIIILCKDEDREMLQGKITSLINGLGLADVEVR